MNPYREAAKPEPRKKRWLCKCLLPKWSWSMTKVRHANYLILGREREANDPNPYKSGRVYIRCAGCDRVWLIDRDLKTFMVVDEEHAKFVGV